MNISQAWILIYQKARFSLDCYGIFPIQLDSKSGFIFFTIILIREYIIQHQDMKDLLQQSYRNIALSSEASI